jgi:hypothetical protein
MAIIIIWAIAGSFVGIFTCNPVHAFWTFSLLPTAKCINTQHYYISTWVPNIVTDLMILCLPQLKVWKLQINTRSKIAVGMVFLLGSLYVGFHFHKSCLMLAEMKMCQQEKKEKKRKELTGLL